MCRKLMMFLLLAAFCSVSFAGADYTVKWDGNAGTTDWHTSGNWLRFGVEGWAGDRGVPESSHRVYIGKDMPSGSNVVVDINSGTAAVERLFLGQNSDACATATLNIASGAILNHLSGTSGYTAVAQGKATINIDGTFTVALLDFAGATVNIGDGGVMSIITPWWQMNSGTTVTVADGGLFAVSSTAASAYGPDATAGIVDLEEGSLFRLTGDKLTGADGYIDKGFVISSTMGANQWLESSYDGTYTYIGVVPEPATLALLGLGGLFIRKKRA